MTVHFSGAGPGAPDLITVRGLRLIQRCPVCLYAGSLVPEEIVKAAPAGARVVDTAPLTLDDIIAEIATAHAKGEDVARVHSGDPSLYGAIAEQMRRLDALAIPYEVVPGVPAFAAAAARLATELTLPEIAQTVILTRTGGKASPMPERERLEIVAAVRRFQSRHGLEPDGVVGRQTIEALNVPVAARVTQIELALERLRWLPELPPGPAIAINIPSFQLWALADASDTRGAALAMPVVVGQALRNETPVFIGAMRAVEFSPYWNVPPAILKNEVLPRLARDPGYLQREGMELVPARGQGAAITTIDAAGLAALRDATMRVRQRPGPKNALGGVKFVLPNTMDVYLHGTPEGQLFERTRRDFSHGCIRVRDPAALAAFVLRELPEWTSGAIAAAMTSGQNRWVRLPAPIPVIVFYTTAIVDGAGRATFMADVYCQDARLLVALRRR